MKIFVGWPYDATWVDEYVIPLIRTYGIQVITGKELHGKEIQEGVIEAMKGVDAGLFFLTRRGEPDDAGFYKTSDWVVDEIKHANATKINTIIEVRESSVIDYPSKIYPERQHILLDPTDRMKFMVELGDIMRRWRGQSLKLKLMPIGQPEIKERFNKDLRWRLVKNEYECSYFVRKKTEVQHGPKTVQIVSEDADFCIYTDELPDSFFNEPDMWLVVHVRMGDDLWECRGKRPNVLEAPLENFESLKTRPDGGPT